MPTWTRTGGGAGPHGYSEEDGDTADDECARVDSRTAHVFRRPPRSCTRLAFGSGFHGESPKRDSGCRGPVLPHAGARFVDRHCSELIANASANPTVVAKPANLPP